MKALFFPFTHVRELDADLIGSCFEQVSYFSVANQQELDQSTNRLLEGLDPIVLATQTLMPVSTAIDDYRNWAKLHGASGDYLKTLLKDAPYFTSDTSVGTLKSGIRKGSVTRGAPGEQGQKTKKLSKEDALTKNLVFLRLAQEVDLENETINRQISSVDESKAELFAAIMGGEAQGFKTEAKISKDEILKPPAEDPGRIMAEKRVAAWAALLREKEGHLKGREPYLPVTTSMAVVDYLEANAEKCRKVLDIDRFKVHESTCKYRPKWRSAIMDAVRCAVAGKEPEAVGAVSAGAEPGDTCRLEAGIKLYLFSGDAISTMLWGIDGQSVNKVFFKGPEQEIPVCLIYENR